MSVYDWHDPFEALRRNEMLEDRDYDFRSRVDEMEFSMRQTYGYENAQLRALNEHLLRKIAELAPINLQGIVVIK